LYAVFESGGRQHKASEGDVIFLEKLDAEVGDTVRFDKVLAYSNEGDIRFGEPYIDGACVKAKVLKQGKDKKIVVFKFKAKKGYRRKQGHRQPHTKVVVETISEWDPLPDVPDVPDVPDDDVDELNSEIIDGVVDVADVSTEADVSDIEDVADESEPAGEGAL